MPTWQPAMSSPAAGTGASPSGASPSGVARKRRAQKRRAEGRSLKWVFSLLQAQSSHHTAGGGGGSTAQADPLVCADCSRLAERVTLLEAKLSQYEDALLGKGDGTLDGTLEHSARPSPSDKAEPESVKALIAKYESVFDTPFNHSDAAHADDDPLVLHDSCHAVDDRSQASSLVSHAVDLPHEHVLHHTVDDHSPDQSAWENNMSCSSAEACLSFPAQVAQNQNFSQHGVQQDLPIQSACLNMHVSDHSEASMDFPTQYAQSLGLQGAALESCISSLRQAGMRQQGKAAGSQADIRQRGKAAGSLR